MVGECADISNHEQVHDTCCLAIDLLESNDFFLTMVLAFRWMDDALNVQPHFIDLYTLPGITTSPFVLAIPDILIQLNLTLKKDHGHCYNDASTM